MNNQVSNDWQFILEDLKPIEREINIKQVKLIHHYFYDTDIIEDTLIEASVEILKKINLEDGNNEWIKRNVNVFLNSNYERKEEVQEKKINNYDELLNNLNNLKLNTLQNNYYYNDEDKEDYWEIIYNNIFKIIGSYKSNLDEFENLSKLLEFESPLEKNKGLVDELLINEGGDESYEI